MSIHNRVPFPVVVVAVVSFDNSDEFGFFAFVRSCSVVRVTGLTLTCFSSSFDSFTSSLVCFSNEATR